jgi:hypothetical protein
MPGTGTLVVPVVFLQNSMFAHNEKYKTTYIFVINCGAAILVFLALTIVPSCTTSDAESIPEITTFAVPDEYSFDAGGGILKVMTLNIGHGKGRGIIQEFISNNKTRENLDEIAGILLRERPHVAAFQEADIKSRRSGNFNHVHYIAEHAGYREAVVQH